jgi:hypothetical protein
MLGGASLHFSDTFLEMPRWVLIRASWDHQILESPPRQLPECGRNQRLSSDDVLSL